MSALIYRAGSTWNADQAMATCNMRGGSVSGASTTTTSTSWATISGTSITNFIKRFSDTDVGASISGTWMAATSPCTVQFGIQINSQDYLIVRTPANTSTSNTHTFHGFASLSGIPAGNYTINMRWLRALGAGTPTLNTSNHHLSCMLEELA